MAVLEVSGLSKSFDAVMAVDQVSFAADQGELIGLLGPSGCGKTTLLRLLAGLEDPDTGTVIFDGRPLDGLAPQQRGFGLMFQDLALFPHMDVFGNVSFGLRMQGLPATKVQARVDELLDLVEMSEYSNRKVHELSGGERQRVALARSLAPAPKLLMLDEPLGSLDRALRDNLQGQVRRILKEVGVTSIYVTHDRDEAFAMADRLVFMNRGTIVQSGTPEEVVAAPADEFVARSLGFKNFLPGVVVGSDEVVKVECALGVLFAAIQDDLKVAEGAEVTLLIDERGIATYDPPGSAIPKSNSFQGMVTERVFRGAGYELKVSTGPVELYCLTSTDAVNGTVRRGREVELVIDPNAIKFLGGATQAPKYAQAGAASRLPLWLRRPV